MSVRFAVSRHSVRARKSMGGDSLLRNSGYLMLSAIVTSLLGAGYWVIAARVFSAAEVGLAATCISAVALVSSIALVGAQSTLVARLPSRESDADWSCTVSTAFAITACTSLVGAGALVLIGLSATGSLSHIARSPVDDVLIISGVLGTSWMAIMDFVALAERRAGTGLFRNFIFSLVKLPLLPALAFMSLTGIILSWMIGVWVGCVVGVWLFRRYGRRYRATVAGLYHEFKSTRLVLAGNYAINLANTVPPLVLPVLVALVKGAAPTAWFYLAWRVSSLFFMVSPTVAGALYAEGTHDGPSLRRQAVRSTKLIALLILPAMLVFFVFGRYILGIFGAQYAHEALPLLWVLTASAIPDAITNVYVSVLRVQRRLRACIGLTGLMAFVTLASAVPLLRTFGIFGGGVAWIAGQLAGSLWVGADIVRRRRGLRSVARPRHARQSLPRG